MSSKRRPTRSSLIWSSQSGPVAAPRYRPRTPAPAPEGTVGPDTEPRATETVGRAARIRAPRPVAPASRDQRARREPRRRTAEAATQPVVPARPANPVAAGSESGLHPLTDRAMNRRLRDYEERTKRAFDDIVPVLKRLSALGWTPDFEHQAQRIAEAELGFQLPSRLLEDAWVAGLDIRTLFAWTVFETYRRMADEFFLNDPLCGRDTEGFDQMIQDCGFHLFDVTPCADGRLAHAVSYVLRLPFAAVRRKSYAGSLFDVENTVAKWVEVELGRYREGKPNTADTPTRYLKAAIYHYSSVDPTHQGCAAHGSNEAVAATAAIERLSAFREAVENSFCCGASVALLLIGLDTDTDAIRIHLPDAMGQLSPAQGVDAAKVHAMTRDLSAEAARSRIAELVRTHAPASADAGMVRLAAQLIENNLSQIDYVRQYQGGHYPDIGHAERFVGAGIGFEEIQLRNLTYFAYLDTVEEGAADLDVGCTIFRGLNVAHGLPIPVVIRFDYHGRVPGARDRAVQRCQRLDLALADRFEGLAAQGMLHRLLAVRDRDAESGIEVIGDSLGLIVAEGH
ncbi:carboxysome shell carbonic anhydrase [Thiocapsa imhoffii]|uniref:Carboxysome shell carbonic anhydrase n=1 Tax=Thiocapsa imhoffii TaxID=382777 RepID=A0A9X1B925_9GAMM|nr:carboxysome shell carbonic anhydrase [Thiocapsa imhoffii]MBK1644616.1 carboxysome shell carbonic anhydrase [Thiocapsa imhoffii]